MNLIENLDGKGNLAPDFNENLVKNVKFRLIGVPLDDAFALIDVDFNQDMDIIIKELVKEYHLNPILDYNLIFKHKVISDYSQLIELGYNPKKDTIIIMAGQKGKAYKHQELVIELKELLHRKGMDDNDFSRLLFESEEFITNFLIQTDDLDLEFIDEIKLFLNFMYEMQKSIPDSQKDQILDLFVEHLLDKDIINDRDPVIDGYTFKVFYKYVVTYADKYDINTALSNLINKEFANRHLKHGVPIFEDKLIEYIEFCEAMGDSKNAKEASDWLERYQFDYYKLTTDQGYTVAFKNDKMRIYYYYPELYIDQLGTDIKLGTHIEITDSSFHHIRDKTLWRLKDIILAHESHGRYIKHKKDFKDMRLYRREVRNINILKRTIKWIVYGDIRPEFDTLPNDWGRLQKILFIAKWNYYQFLKNKYEDNAKWAFLSYFEPDFMKEYFRDKYDKYYTDTPDFSEFFYDLL